MGSTGISKILKLVVLEFWFFLAALLRRSPTVTSFSYKPHLLKDNKHVSSGCGSVTLGCGLSMHNDVMTSIVGQSGLGELKYWLF